jgi:hypothetical protein
MTFDFNLCTKVRVYENTVEIRVGKPRGKPFRGARRVPRRAAPRSIYHKTPRRGFIKWCFRTSKSFSICSDMFVFTKIYTVFIRKQDYRRFPYRIAIKWNKNMIDISFMGKFCIFSPSVFVLSAACRSCRAAHRACRAAPRHAAAGICRFTLHWSIMTWLFGYQAWP